ncbi:MAG: twin-arginine translocase subunit TatC [Alphaproteobacteria bacterium]|nr:twin-arginine translocase subunit TatC [Alphaproteobacteria bacterium]
MPLLEHLIELRQRLIWSALAFFVCFVVAYVFHKEIFSVLVAPMNKLPNPEGRRMIFTAPTEAFFTYVKLSAWGAVCIAFPIVANQIWKFVAPGLYNHEKSAFLPFLIATPFMFALGAAFLYFLILPYGLAFFASFEIPREVGGNVPIQFEAKMNEYLSFVMALILAFGISFELPVLLVLLCKVGIISSRQLQEKRRYAIVGLVTFAAIVTPPDVFSQLALAIPMYILYEVAIWVAKIIEPREDEEEEEETSSTAPTSSKPAGAAAAGARAAIFDENDFNLAR